MPEAAEATAPEAKPQSPFAAALDKAFADPEAAKTATPEAKKEAPAPKKEDEPSKPAEDKKSGTPRDLFKPKSEAKPGDSTPETKSAIDEIAAPEFKDEKGKKGWDALKGEAKNWEAKAKQFEREATERKTSGRDTEALEARVAELQKQIKDSEDLVARVRLDDHPAFRREFIDGRQKVIDRAKSIVEEGDGDPKAIETALNLKGRARAEALREASKDLDTFQAGRLGRAVDELNDLDERAQQKRDAAKKSYDDLKEQERQRGIEDSATSARKRGIEFDEVSRRLTDGLEVLKQADGFDEWNARAKRIISEARAHVDTHPQSDIEAEILARVVPAYRDMFVEADRRAEELEDKLKEREAELTAIHNGGHSLKSRGASNGSVAKTETKRPFSESFGSQMQGA